MVVALGTISKLGVIYTITLISSLKATIDPIPIDNGGTYGALILNNNILVDNPGGNRGIRLWSDGDVTTQNGIIRIREIPKCPDDTRRGINIVSNRFDMDTNQLVSNIVINVEFANCPVPTTPPSQPNEKVDSKAPQNNIIDQESENKQPKEKEPEPIPQSKYFETIAMDIAFGHSEGMNVMVQCYGSGCENDAPEFIRIDASRYRMTRPLEIDTTFSNIVAYKSLTIYGTKFSSESEDQINCDGVDIWITKGTRLIITPGKATQSHTFGVRLGGSDIDELIDDLRKMKYKKEV
jgi:hypothetical protein